MVCYCKMMMMMSLWKDCHKNTTMIRQRTSKMKPKPLKLDTVIYADSNLWSKCQKDKNSIVAGSKWRDKIINVVAGSKWRDNKHNNNKRTCGKKKKKLNFNCEKITGHTHKLCPTFSSLSLNFRSITHIQHARLIKSRADKKVTWRKIVHLTQQLRERIIK